MQTIEQENCNCVCPALLTSRHEGEKARLSGLDWTATPTRRFRGRLAAGPTRLAGCILLSRQPQFELIGLVHHRRITGIATVTESVVLPPFHRRGLCPSPIGPDY
jgi:hypothetical protein